MEVQDLLNGGAGFELTTSTAGKRRSYNQCGRGFTTISLKPLTSLGGVNMRLQKRLSLDVLMIPYFSIPCFSSRTGNQDSTPSEYWQPIPQKCSYMGLMCLEYFSISPSGQGQQIIPDAVMSWICTVTWNLKALALMDVIWLVYQV